MCARRVSAQERVGAQERELSDYTSQGREKIRMNNFRVSLPRCRAVREGRGMFDDSLLVFVRSIVRAKSNRVRGVHPPFILAAQRYILECTP